MTMPDRVIMVRESAFREMRGALKDAEAMFRWYGDLHSAKPDHDKARRNYGMADQCAAALQRAEAEPCK